jgi:hypothetical protein
MHYIYISFPRFVDLGLTYHQCCITTVLAVYRMCITFLPDTLVPNDLIRRSKVNILRAYLAIKISIAPRVRVYHTKDLRRFSTA